VREPTADEPRDKRLTETARRQDGVCNHPLTAAQARPAGLARIMHGHWGNEDRLHRLPA
jgi:hypothetical protein